MLKLLASRLLQMIFIMGVISLILFAIFDSDKFKKQIAVNELGGFAVSALSDQDYQAWLEKKGLHVPFYERYLNWAGGVARGDFGKSFEKMNRWRACWRRVWPRPASSPFGFSP